MIMKDEKKLHIHYFEKERLFLERTKHRLHQAFGDLMMFQFNQFLTDFCPKTNVI